jgi:hypothetical protein
VVDDMGNVEVVPQAAAATTAMVLSVEQRRLSTKLLGGMKKDGVLDQGALRILLKMAERTNAGDAPVAEAAAPVAPVAESEAAAPAEPHCGFPIPPPTVRQHRRDGTFESKGSHDVNLLDRSTPNEDYEAVVGHEALECVQELFDNFKNEVFRVPTKDVDCSVTATADLEYLRNSDVEAWQQQMGVETGNKFKTHRCPR